MTTRQWQEVYSIVRKKQKVIAGSKMYEDEYRKLGDILSELYSLAYDAEQCVEKNIVL